MTQTYKNPSWALKADKLVRFAFQRQAFSAKECDDIIQLGKSQTMHNGIIGVQGEQVVNEEIRNCNLCFLSPGQDTEWIYRRLTDIVLMLNEQYFQFDLWSFSEHLQFTEYEAPGGKYNAHVDKTYDNVVRKLSIVVQLTEEDEYEGCDLEIIDSDTSTPLERTRGTLLAFPSFTLHRVSPITSGTRHSLVGWVSGPQFK